MIIDNRLQPLLTSARFLPTSAPSRVRLFPARQVTPPFSLAVSNTRLSTRPAPRSSTSRKSFSQTDTASKFPARWAPFAKGIVDKRIWFVSGLHSVEFLPPPQGLTFFSAPFSLARRVWEFSWIHFFETPRPGNPTFLHGRRYFFPVDPYFGTFEREKNRRARLFPFPRLWICDGRDLRFTSREEQRIKLDKDRDTPFSFTEC